MPVAKPLAQTNVQLFNQLIDAGYAAQDVAAIRDAYVLAARLFSSLYRASGKTFVAHAVGTASALAEARAPAAVVVAGLLHAAYTHGDFGTLRRRIDARKRGRLSATIGARAESLVHAYATQPWDEAVVRDALERPGLDPRRDVLLMRLANELDDADERAGLYTAQWRRYVADARTLLPLCAAYARRLDAEPLAVRLENAAAVTLESPSPLVSTFAGSASLAVPPASLRPRVRLVARSIFNAGRPRRRL